MAYLPSETIVQAYGGDTLAWLAVRSVMSGDIESKFADAERLAGYDRDLLWRSRQWCGEKLSWQGTGRIMLKQYDISDRLLRGDLDALDLQKLLQEAAKPDIEISEKRADDYELVPVTTRGNQPRGYIREACERIPENHYYKTYLDTPVGFLLNYKGWPNAVIGMGMSSQDEAMVHQLQSLRPRQIAYEDGVLSERRRSSRGLMPIDWQRFMMGVAEYIVSEAGLNSIGVQTGAKNHWVHHAHPGEQDPPLTHDEAYRAYDVPAKRLGFTRGPDLDWHKPL